LNVYTK